MQGLSEKKITGTEGGRFRTIANLLYEAISGLPDADLKRAAIPCFATSETAN